MKNKEDALKDFVEMISHSWTYGKMNEKERVNLDKMFRDVRTIECLRGNYYQRWSILQALYSSFLQALDYTPNWREEI